MTKQGLIKLAPLQIYARACQDFEKYFIAHIDELATNDSEKTLIQNWKLKGYSKEIMKHPHEVTEMRLQSDEGCGFLHINFIVGSGNHDYCIFNDDKRPIVDILYKFLSSNMEFVPWYEEPRYYNCTHFKMKIINDFIQATYPKELQQTWCNMGVIFYDDKEHC